MKKKSEILSLEKPMSPRILLHREGIFLRAYEYSAYYFHQYIRPTYRLHKRFVRVVQQDLVYLGFPSEVLPQLLHGMSEVIPDRSLGGGDLVVLRLAAPAIDREELDAFKETIPYSPRPRRRRLADHLEGETAPLLRPSMPESYQDLISRIRSFDLKGSTALEVAAFVGELQDEYGHPEGADAYGEE